MAELVLRDDEYEKDGIFYCKKCHTPRAARVTTNEVGMLMLNFRCLCKCQRDAVKAEVENFQKKMRQMEVAMMKGSVLGRRYAGVSFSETQKGLNKTFDAALARCEKYCAAATAVLDGGFGLYIWGDAGTGKTHLAACMAAELIEHGYQVLMTNLAEIDKNGKEKRDYIDKLSSIDFLIFDDVGVDRVKTANGDSWLQSRMYEVINARYIGKKPTIFTSNYSLSELITARGVEKRTVDRIAEMASAVVKIEGDSFRLKERAAAKLPF